MPSEPDPDETLTADRGEAGPDADASVWRVHGRREVYDSSWIKIGLADVALPDGERFEHHTVWMPPAAMTAVVDDAEASVLMMWRHRFVPNLWNWELPGGIVEVGEEPIDAAAREVEEETGYRLRTLEHLVTFEPMIGAVAGRPATNGAPSASERRTA